MSSKLSFFVSFELNGKVLYKISEEELAEAISAVLPEGKEVEPGDIMSALNVLKMDVVSRVRGE